MHGTPHSGPWSGNEAVLSVMLLSATKFILYFKLVGKKTKKHSGNLRGVMCSAKDRGGESRRRRECEGEAELTSDEES